MIDYNDYTELSGEMVRARTPDRRVTTRPMLAAVPPPPQAEPPSRFATGTSPGGTTRVGLTAAPPLPDDDDHTTPGLLLGDYTTPDLPLADRTQPGLAIGPTRPSATRPVAIPSLRGRSAR